MLDVKFKVNSRMLADYMSYLFPDSDAGSLKVSATTVMGKLLVAHCRSSERPVPDPSGGTVFTLELPHDAATKQLLNKFLFYSPSSLAALNMALAAVFEIDFNRYYIKGLELGLQKKDIVTAFIVSRGLFSGDCFDALHKRIYRRSQRTLESLTDKLLQKAYYIDRTIDTKGLDND